MSVVRNYLANMNRKVNNCNKKSFCQTGSMEQLHVSTPASSTSEFVWFVHFLPYADIAEEKSMLVSFFRAVS